MNREERFRYYASREWALLKERVRERSGGICERCESNPHEATHHLTYARLGHERLEDLQGVCEACHEFLSGKSSIDPSVPNFSICFRIYVHVVPWLQYPGVPLSLESMVPNNTDVLVLKAVTDQVIKKVGVEELLDAPFFVGLIPDGTYPWLKIWGFKSLDHKVFHATGKSVAVVASYHRIPWVSDDANTHVVYVRQHDAAGTFEIVEEGDLTQHDLDSLEIQ